MLTAFLPTRHRPAKDLALAPLAISKPAEVIDPRALAQAMQTAAIEAQENSTDPTRALLAIARPALEAGEAEIRQRFFSGKSTAGQCLVQRAHLVDAVVGGLADVAMNTLYPVHNPTMSERLTIIAVGGYGRGELAPFSDIDLLFLLPYKRSPVIEQIVECLLYVLWDTGLKVGNATRSLPECLRSAETDITIRTALLDARPLWGDEGLWDLFQRGFERQFGPSGGHQFAVAKLAERDARHKRMGDTRYILEPNIKEGKGGLRDLHTLYWIAKYFYRTNAPACLVEAGVMTADEARTCRKALRFLSTIRCHLHYLTNRADEVLTFDVQPEMAERLGYSDRAGVSGVERFMKHYFLVAKQVGDLTRIVCAGLEIDARPRGPRRFLPFGDKLAFANETVELDGFVVRASRLDLPRSDHFTRRPVDLIRIFAVAQTHNVDIHPRALKQMHRVDRSAIPKLRSSPKANKLFLDILTGSKNPELTLRAMSEAGILGRFVPDFGRIIAQMQYDMYHVYTVDEHTIRALSILHTIGSGEAAERLPLASRVMGELTSRRALVVALFLHDIAKGRGGDHSVLGARVAKRLCPRFGLTKEECETVEWLVRHHLDMSNIAFRRDVEDEKTVQDFAELVESPERLRLLLVLTTVDINAVGPGRWTSWNATLIGQLFSRTIEVLAGGQDSALRWSARVEQAENAFGKLAAAEGWTPAEIEEFVSIGIPTYWLSFDAETHLHHAGLTQKAKGQKRPLAITSRMVTGRKVTEVTVYAVDHAGLSSLIAGAITVAGGRILDARLFTLSNGMALDVFSIHNLPTDGMGGQSEKLDKVADTIGKTLRGEIDARKLLAQRSSSLPKRSRAFAAAPRVVVDNQASNQCTVIEVNGRDRPGILFDLSCALTDAGLRIASAKITTYGERVVDVFYVKDIFGLKVTSETKLKQVREVLMAALAPPAEAKPERAAAKGKKAGAAKPAEMPKSRRSVKPVTARPAKRAGPKDKNGESTTG